MFDFVKVFIQDDGFYSADSLIYDEIDEEIRVCTQSAVVSII